MSDLRPIQANGRPARWYRRFGRAFPGASVGADEIRWARGLRQAGVRFGRRGVLFCAIWASRPGFYRHEAEARFSEHRRPPPAFMRAMRQVCAP